MTKLLEIRQQFKVFYTEYERVLTRLFRFLFSFLVIYFVNLYMGQNVTLRNPVVSIILALVCAIVPVSAVAPITILCILGQFYAISLEITLVTFAICIVMVLLYYIFKCGNSWIMSLMILLCIWNVPGIFIIAFGLIISPIGVVPAVFGAFIFRMMELMKTQYVTIFSQSSESVVQKIVWFITKSFSEKSELLLIVAIIVVVLFVYGIRRLSVDYAWPIAIATGTGSYLLIMLLGNFALDISVDIVFVLLNAFLGVIVSLILYLFVFAVDYTRTEYVQFEDEDYYYYVKAVPKISVTASDWKVKHITITEKEEVVNEETENTTVFVKVEND